MPPSTNIAGTPTGAACPDPAFRLGYRRWLDGLRGWAILLVLLFHLGFLQGGSLGVDVFFVLSGFLITTLLVEEWQRRGSISLKHFYARRALRLLPAFGTLLLIHGLYSWLFLPADEASAQYWGILAAGLYIANWPTLHGITMAGLGHTWSLSIEEQFYVLWPALLLLMLALRLSRRRIIQVVCLGILACVTWRVTLYHLYRFPPDVKTMNIVRMYLGLDTRADSLLAGCLAGLIVTSYSLPTSRRFLHWLSGLAILSAVAVGYLAVFSSLTQAMYFHGLFTVLALCVGLIIVRMVAAPSRLGSLLLDFAPLVGLGRISYGLYLWHGVIICWLKPAGLGWRNPGTVILIAGLSLAAALASYFAVERPFLRLKDRLSQRTAVQPAARIPLSAAA